jgi:hypothetical protein
MRLPGFTAEASFDRNIISYQKNDIGAVSEITTPITLIPLLNGPLPPPIPPMPSGGSIPDIGTYPGLEKPQRPDIEARKKRDFGFRRCNGKITNILHDHSNCGGCGNRCHPLLCTTGGQCYVETCENGRCTFPCGEKSMCLSNVQPNRIDVECKDLEHDIKNCGLCGRDCSVMYPGSTCEPLVPGSGTGYCKCPASAPTDCGRMDKGGAGCVNLNIDPNNCGSCGNKCKLEEYCDNGKCKFKSCPKGQTPICRGFCEDIDKSSCCSKDIPGAGYQPTWKCGMGKGQTACYYQLLPPNDKPGDLIKCEIMPW